MRLALAFLLLCVAPLCRGAITGNTNILGAWTDGWNLNVHIGGDAATFFGTNDQFYGGFLTSLSSNATLLTGTQKCTLTITTSNWNSTGGSVVGTRTIYGGKLRRLPWPLFNTNRVYDTDGTITNVIVQLSLSDYIYAGESVSLTTRTGWIVNTNGGVDAAVATALAVTNQSQFTFGLHSEPSINWAHPGQRRWTNETEYVYLDGGHWSGIAGIKVEAMEGVNTQTVWAVHVPVSPSGRGPRHGLWVAGIPTSTFSNFANVRIDYIAYPIVGTNVFDTRLDRWTGPTPLPSSQTNFWDRFNSFTNFAIVGLPAGAAPTVTNGAPANVHPDNYFGTVDAAYAALVLTNRNNIGISNVIGTVLVRTGVTNIMGGTATAGPTSPSWAILKNYPGDLVTFTNSTGDSDVADCWKLEGDTSGGGGLVLDVDSSIIPFSGVQRLWLDGITIDSASSQFIATCAHVSVTDCNITRMGQGLIPTGAQNTSFALLRDLYLTGLNGVWIYTAIGLRTHGLTNSSFGIVNTRVSSAGHGAPFAAHVIFTDSALLECTTQAPINFGAGAPGFSPTNDCLHGMYVENIVIENTNSNASATMFASGNTTNAVFRNVVLRGPRNQLFYNETTNWWHVTPRIYNCIFANTGFAADLAPQANPWLTNSAAYLHQVGSSGNVYSQITGLVQHNWPDFSGINNLIPGTVAGTFPSSFVKFQRMAGYVGSGAGAGGGDYRLLSDNFLFAIPGYGALPTHQPDSGFDREGKPRRAGAPPGDLVDGDIRMAGLF